MRSYYAHLSTTAPAEGAIAPRPTFRSSAIFPVMQTAGISSRILFMGYWMLKRNIKEIACVITLRDLKGTILARHTQMIVEAKTYRIELADELERSGKKRFSDFDGSLEVEFFSTQNLFFPFPAVVINYYGPNFSTVVHTAQRVYNDYEDKIRNSDTAVPESGFNIYADEDIEPFIALINGCTKVENSTLRLQMVNHEQEVMECTIDLGPLSPYETKWIYPARHCELKRFLEGRPGAAKIHFNVDWIFPRLVVGNIHHSIPALSITHTYYDCSVAMKDSDYWRPVEDGWYAASLMVPGEVASDHFTNVYFYPIYSPSTFAVDAEIYDTQGKRLGRVVDVAKITAPHLQVHRIPVKTLFKDFLPKGIQECALRLIARPLNGSRMPSRIKIGFDIGSTDENAPCNICTNLQPFNPPLENKPQTFRWSPVLADQPFATLWIMNSSPAIDYKRTADVTVTFYRESDNKTLVRNFTLNPHGFVTMRIDSDEELRSFFQGQVGWMTATSSNAYMSTYYFTESSVGVVGGDHGF